MMTIDATRIPEIQISQNAFNKDGPVNLTTPSKKISEMSFKTEGESQLQSKVEAQDSKSAGENTRGNIVSTKQIKKLIHNANDTLKRSFNKQLSFFFDEKSGKTGVRIIDAETHKVIKQIPPEEMLKLAARLREQIGAFIDELI